MTEGNAFALRRESREQIISGGCDPLPLPVPGVELREFVSEQCGASGFSTGTATFLPGAELPYHTHAFSEAITILHGEAVVAVEGGEYRLTPYDCIHVPAGTAHRVACSGDLAMLALCAYASAQPSRNFVDDGFRSEERTNGHPTPGNPEFIRRFAAADVYELSDGAFFRDLFAGRYGSRGICGGYGLFRPGASLPCHFHRFDESITIVTGKAVCLVEGRRYELSGYDTAFVPVGRVHRFLNHSDEDMAMIWVYAGTEPERTIVEASYCSGEAVWPGAQE
jgi:quercetin dioxygenase-like cupin family protein